MSIFTKKTRMLSTSIRCLIAGFFVWVDATAQETVNIKYKISLIPSYTYYGSIDEIHSPYRYEGRNFSLGATFSVYKNTKFHTLSLSYESLMRYPVNLPVQESIIIESYDNSRGTYVWPTTASFLKKQTYLLQQSFSGHYRLPVHLFSGEWFLGYQQELSIVNCPNLPMLELLSISLGPSGHCRIPLTLHITYELSLNASLFSLDIRNSYASVDGYVGEEKNFSYYYDYFRRHVQINGLWRHSVFSLQHALQYHFNTNFAIQAGYQLLYRRLEAPRLLKSMMISYQLGIQYAW